MARTKKQPAKNSGSANGNAKLDEIEVKAIKRKLKKGATVRAVAREFARPETTISSIKRGRTWKHIKV